MAMMTSGTVQLQRVCVAVAAACLVFGGHAFAQGDDGDEDASGLVIADEIDASPPEKTGDAMKDLAARKEYYDALAAYYAARTKALDAAVPQATLPQGTFTQSEGDVPLAVWTGAYAGHHAAGALGTEIRKATNPVCGRVLLAGPEEVAAARGSVALLESVVPSAAESIRSIGKTDGRALAGTFGGVQTATKVLDSVAAIMAYFRQDVTAVVGQSDVLKASAIRSDLAGAILRKSEDKQEDKPAYKPTLVYPLATSADAKRAHAIVKPLRDALGNKFAGEDLKQLQAISTGILADIALEREAGIADTCFLGVDVRTESHAAITRKSAFRFSGSNEGTATIGWQLVKADGTFVGGGSIVAACHTPLVTKRPAKNALTPACTTTRDGGTGVAAVL